MGRVFRLLLLAVANMNVCLNPRFVGRVFRPSGASYYIFYQVLIPDLWGESSDAAGVVKSGAAAAS